MVSESGGEGGGKVDVGSGAEEFEQHQDEVVDDEEEDEEGAGEGSSAQQVTQVLFEGPHRLLHDALVHLLRALSHVGPRVKLLDPIVRFMWVEGVTCPLCCNRLFQ